MAFMRLDIEKTLRNYRKSIWRIRIRKAIAMKLLGAILINISGMTVSYAQTSGPGQSETQGNSGGASDMVSLFTGDFNYSIPLMNVEGYPINLNYDANVTMHQEASWVGLGWNLNVGSISREMRGLPDDFNNDTVTKVVDIKDNLTLGKNVGVNMMVNGNFGLPGTHGLLSIYGGVGLEFKFGDYTNSYTNFGKNYELNVNGNVGVSAAGIFSHSHGISLGFSRNTQTGIGLTGGINSLTRFNYVPFLAGTAYGSAITLSMNSRTGRSLYISANKTKQVLLSASTISGGRQITFGTKTYTPQFNNSLLSASNFTRNAGGLYLNGIVASIWAMSLTENYAINNVIATKTETIPSYGYLSLQNGSTNEKKLMDYNRENEVPASDEIQVLPVTNLTYDLFNMSTGFGNVQFRAHRNDVGTVCNTKNTIASTAHMTGLEQGYGTFYKKVTSNGASVGNGESHVLGSGFNANFSSENYKNVFSSSGRSETFYFKQVGELTPANQTFFDNWGGNLPVRRTADVVSVLALPNVHPGVSGNLIPYTTNGSAPPLSLPSNTITDKKDRSILYQHLTAGEATQIGFNTTIPSTVKNTGSTVGTTITNGNRVTSKKKAHHISEFTVVKPEGERYIFNIPAYSLKEKQVMFNISGRNTECDQNEAFYDEDTDNSANNIRGRDNLFHSEQISAYAHSYLIGAILTQDYNDVTNDGLTSDDYGSYIKFNHSCVYGESNPFKWRAPYRDEDLTGASPGFSNAPIMEGTRTYTDDDLSMYTYGEKELWYPHSIEGKNYIAYFFISAREDMFSVQNENGQRDESKPGYKLDRIVLYSKEDIRQRGVSNAEPLQTVEFEYDYSLCKNYSGNKNKGTNYNKSGKLTLKKVYLSSSKSKKGRLNPYVFTYNSSTKNPDYNPLETDRWSVFKPNTCGYATTNVYYPYATKNKTDRDNHAQCWLLYQVKMPSGGLVNVEFESDDYGYVEDRKAMEMFSVIGLTQYDNIASYPSMSPSLTKPSNKTLPNDVLYVQLDEPLESANTTLAKTEFYEKYLKDIVTGKNKMYYRFLIKNKKTFDEAEWVHGHAKILDWGVADLGDNIAWIRIESMNVDDRANPYAVNPIMYAAWQNIRKNVSRVIYPDNGSGTLILDISTLLNGVNRSLNVQQLCRNIYPNASMVRLLTPSGKKIGGGHRVKKITFNDNWAAMSTEEDFTYGQTYSYSNENGESYGVAAYEPTLGNEENPYKLPVNYIVDNDKLPDDFLFHTEPFGETFTSAPMVGYSKVIVRNLARNNVTRNATGRMEYDFYTAKEFPTKFLRTNLNKVPYDNSGSLAFFALSMGVPQLDLMACTQGFSIVKNDMHGKPYKVVHFNETGSEVFSEEFKYKAFDASCNVIDKTGTKSSAILGRDMDVVIDANTTDMIKIDLGGATAETYTLPPSFQSGMYFAFKKTVYATHCITKVIHNYGVIDQIVRRYNGQESLTKFLAYDKQTGQLLVSHNTNDFETPVYSTASPAYWYHKGMGPATDTYNNHFIGINISGGIATISGISTRDYFHEGDELMINNAGTYTRAWVLLTGSGTTMRVIDREGDPITGLTGVDIRVIRSGKRNMHSIPMQTIVSLGNPIHSSRMDLDTSILDASATLFSHYWSTNCNTPTDCSGTQNNDCMNPGDYVNPFVTGILGNWRPKQSYLYKVDRREKLTSTTVYLKNGGTYDSFVPFFEYNVSPSNWYAINESNHPEYSATYDKWIKAEEIFKYDPNGNPVEIQNATGQFDATQYGYGKFLRLLPVATANNAKLRQIAFDGFEDYLFRSDLAPSCNDKYHFDFGSLDGEDLSSEAHTGRYSLRVPDGLAKSTTRHISSTCDTLPLTYSMSETEDGVQFELPDCNCMNYFSPSPGKYVFSVWVKQSVTTPVETYADAYVRIKTKDGGATLSDTTFQDNILQAMVDGWQRLEGEITIEDEADCIEIYLGNSGNSLDLYFDDFRIHPFQSSMFCSVYDPITLRLWAELDDYNFARFFEYDENGAVVRIKQETIEGKKTLNETRQALGK